MALEEAESTCLDLIRSKWYKKWTKEVSMELDNQELQPKVATSLEVKVLEEVDLMLPLVRKWTSWINKSLPTRTCMTTVCQTDILSDIAVGLEMFLQSMDKNKTYTFPIHQTWWRWSFQQPAMEIEVAQTTTHKITTWTCKIFKSIFENDYQTLN